MIKTFAQLLRSAPETQLLAALESALSQSSESLFWKQKVPPMARALFSVLVPLRDRHLLFDPEGNPQTDLTPALVLRWCDLVSLKTLAFTLQRSNVSGRLERTRYDTDKAESYRTVDLEVLGGYLSGYTVNLENEALDFPIAHYNLHVGLAGVLETLMK